MSSPSGGSPTSTDAAPAPLEIYQRAVREGDRRLSMSTVSLVSTGFNAGFTIVLGIIGLAIVEGLVSARLGEELGRIAGAAAFGIGVVFLTTSRSELFTENFFDPIASIFESGDRQGQIARLIRLWTIVLAMNLVGGAVLVWIASVDGVLPASAEVALRRVAEDVASTPPRAALANAAVGGALVTLLSFLLQAATQVVPRMIASYLVGFALAVGPFAHVVVTFHHLLAGRLAGASISAPDVLAATALATAGNLVGGIAFVTFTHVAQARGDADSG